MLIVFNIGVTYTKLLIARANSLTEALRRWHYWQNRANYF